MSKTTVSVKVKKSPGQSRLILWGLLLGLVCGLFFEEYCRPLQLVGLAYVVAALFLTFWALPGLFWGVAPSRRNPVGQSSATSSIGLNEPRYFTKPEPYNHHA